MKLLRLKDEKLHCLRYVMNRQFEKNEKVKNIVLSYAINAVLVTDCINAICLALGAPTVLATAVRNIGYIMVILYATYIIVYKRRLEYLVAIIIIGLCIIMSELRISSEQPELIKMYVFVLIRVFPVFVLSLHLDNADGFLESLKPYIAVAVLYGTINAVALDTISTNYMTFSYNMLIPALLAFYFYINDKKILYLLAFIYLMLIVLVMGARGPIACGLAGCIFIFFLVNDKLTAKTTLIVLLCTLLLVVLIAFSHQVLLALSSHFPEARTLELLLNSNSIGYFLTGRGELYKHTVELINDNWLLGLGVFSSNISLAQKLGNDIYSQGIYPHNFMLDVWLQFGIIVGTLLLTVVTLMIARSMRRLKKLDKKGAAVLLLFVSRSIGLLVSSTYIIEPTFWFMIGYCLTSKRIKMANGEYTKNGIQQNL